METEANVGGRDRLLRGLLAAVLSVVAVRALARGKRVTGVVSGVGALGLGFNATTGYCGGNDALGVDTTREEGANRPDAPTADATPSPTQSTTDRDPRGTLTCAACGGPIRVGQPRGPDEDDRIVHRNCS